MRSWIMAATCMGTLVACTSPADVADALHLRADRSQYAAGSSIEASITNTSNTSWFVSHCNHEVSIAVEERVAGVWRNAAGAICLGIYESGEVQLARGQTRVAAAPLQRAGEYRLLLYARRGSEDFGSTVVYSEPFIIAD